MRGANVVAGVTGLLLLAPNVSYGQAAAKLEFEVASVKLTAPKASAAEKMSGGPGTSDPEHFSFPNATLKQLLLRAYGLREYQFSGPSWLGSTLVDILAKVPPGTTQEQFNAMLQNLLVERFNLTFHHEAKEILVYEMTVAKNGLKLKESDLKAKPPERDSDGRLVLGKPDKDGLPQLPPGSTLPLIARTTNGITRMTGRSDSLSDLASFLGPGLSHPIVDKTGLTGKYDFKLAFSSEGFGPPRLASPSPLSDTPTEPGPSLLKAVEDQLGLKLEPKKDLVDILVVDHIDRVPTEN
jgi:uncharacterized protein (TIGR03435 family)